MQDETQTPGAAQEPNNAPDPGAAANPGGSEGLGRDPSGEVPAAAPTDQGGSPFEPAASVGGAAVGAGAVGEAGGPGQTIEDAGETILDPPGDAGAAGDVPFGGAFDPVGEAIEHVAEAPGLGEVFGRVAGDVEATAADETTEFTRLDENLGYDSGGDIWVNLDYLENQAKVEALGDAAEDVGESTVDFVGGIPIIGDDIGDALREGYDVVEDVVDHADDPAVVEDVDPWG
jgi:hypothetical protein